MPRQARLDVPGALHRIMVRGINKSGIFKDDGLIKSLLAVIQVRRSRIDVLGALPHIITRRIEKGRTFRDDLLERLGKIEQGAEPGEGAKLSLLSDGTVL